MVGADLLDRPGSVDFHRLRDDPGLWGSAYYVEKYHYLTPFYSPCVSASCVEGARHFGTWVGELPWFIPMAFISLPFCWPSG